MTVCTINNINNMFAQEVFLSNHVDLIVKYHQAPEFSVRTITCVSPPFPFPINRRRLSCRRHPFPGLPYRRH
jgi:hypothetical protein